MSTTIEAARPASSRATRLTLLCRGATAANRQARFSADGPLLAKDRNHAAALAAGLYPFDRVMHAPEESAAETAAAFSSQATACPDLRDVDYGTWSEQRSDDIAARFADDLSRWMNDPGCAPHGGESLETAAVRAVRVMNSLHGAGGRVLAVTHPVIVKLVFAHIVGAPLTAVWRIDVEPFGRLDLSSDGRRWALRGFGTGLSAAGQNGAG